MMANPREWFSRLGAAFKALTTIRFPSGTAWSWSWPVRHGLLDYGRVGDGGGNSAVMACVQFICRAFPESPLIVERRDADGVWATVPTHPLADLLERPNPAYSGVHLWNGTLADRLLTGNSYWLKRRSGTGKPVELWWLPACYMEPKRRDGADEFITHYEYKPNGVEIITYEPSEIVHFRDGFDPTQPMRGRSPLRAALGEVFTDDEATRYTAAILHNLGVPGVIISPKADDAELTPDQTADLKNTFSQKFSGEHRGEPMVCQGALDVNVLSFNPTQMDLANLRRLPEERITAILGIPAAVVGLGAGLETTKVGATMAEMREQAYESCIIPMQRLYSAELNTQLLPDFDDPKRARVTFDLSEVRVLQTDMDKLFARLDLGVQHGWLKVADARRDVGLPTTPADEIYLRPANVVAVLATERPAPALSVASRPPLQLKAADPEPDDDTATFLVALDALRDKLEAPMLAALTAFLLDQAVRVGERLGRQATILSVYPQTEQALLRETLEPWYRTVLAGLHAPAQAVLGVTWGIEDPQVLAYLGEAGARIRGIDQTTFQAVARLLQDGRAAGLTPVQIAQQMQDDFAFSASRAETVVRTELAQAASAASLTHFQASGVVVGVVVHDGDYDPVCAAMNGRRFTLAEARSLPRTAHPRCLVGGSLVVAPNVQATFTRWFDGEVVVLRTAADDFLTCTPNHPILTDRGWVAASLLHEGDYVVRSLDSQRIAALLNPNHDYMPALIEQIADTAWPAGRRTAATVPTAAEDFHGDGAGSEVCVIRTDRGAELTGDLSCLQHGGQCSIKGAEVGLGLCTSGGLFAEVIPGLRHATHRGMGRGGKRGAALWPRGSQATAHSFGAVGLLSDRAQPIAGGSFVNAELGSELLGRLAANGREARMLTGAPRVPENVSTGAEVTVQRGSTDTDHSGQLLASLAGLVTAVQICKVERRQFAGHVYNLETTQGWYIAENIITHNCRRAFAPLTDVVQLEATA